MLTLRTALGALRRVSALTLVGGLIATLSPGHAGLIGFYSFDDPSDPLKDDAGLGNTLQGGVADPTYIATGGFEGGAYVFNGAQRLISPININTGFLPNLTMGAWVKTSSLTAGWRKFIGHDDGGFDRTLGLDTRNGGFRYTAFIGNGDPMAGVAPRSTNEWTFVAATYDDWAGQLTLYVDLDALSIGDALVVNTSATGFASGQDTVAIGGLRPDNADEGWLGAMDNVFFYDEVLTLEQLTAIRDRGRGAILGSGGEDPDLRIVSEPALRNLAKAPAVQSFSFGIKNLGNSKPLTISQVAVTGAHADRYRVTQFPPSLAPDATGTIAFTFDSRGQVGAFTAALEIASNDPSNPIVLLNASAQVGDDPDLVFTAIPNLQDLAKLPPLKTLSFPVQNGGVFDTLHITKVELSGPDAGYYSVRGFPASLAPGATGAFEFTLDPKGQVGSFSAQATITSDDASTPVYALDLSARITGTALLGFYPFDAAENPIQDESGNGRTLRRVGNDVADPIYQPQGGFSGGGYDFEGGQRLIVPLNINPSQIPVLTMGAWVKTTAQDPGLYKVIGNDDGGWDRVIGLDNRTMAAGGPMPNGTYRYVAFTGVNNHGPTQGDPAPTPIGPDNWTFIAAVYDHPAKQVTLYVDLDVASIDDDPQAIEHVTAVESGATTTAIGAIAPGGGEGWVGSIDNVFFLGGRADAEVIRSVRDLGKDGLLQLRPDPVLVAPRDPLFGDQPGSDPVTVSVTLQNAGQTQPLTIADRRITGRDAVRYTVANVPGSLAPGGSSTFQVTFDPGGREGYFEAVLDLISNSSSDRHAQFNLNAFVPYASPLIGFYPFDDPADPLRNATGKGSDLILPAGAAPVFEPAGGVEGGAFAFNGLQRLIAPININPVRLPQLTMGAWVKTDSLTPGLRKVIGHDDGGWDRTIGLDTRDVGFRYTAFVGNAAPLPGTPAPASTEDWTFLAATFDQNANALALYVDLDAATITDDLSVTLANGTGFGSGFNTTAIGGLRPDNADEGWQGLIDNVFFYQAVLSVDELTRIRNGGAAAILPPVAPAPRITSIQRGADLALTWTSVPERTYSVEYSNRLPAQWASIATVTSQGSTTTYKDMDAARLGRAAGFYRVVLTP